MKIYFDEDVLNNIDVKTIQELRYAKCYIDINMKITIM